MSWLDNFFIKKLFWNSVEQPFRAGLEFSSDFAVLDDSINDKILISIPAQAAASIVPGCVLSSNSANISGNQLNKNKIDTTKSGIVSLGSSTNSANTVTANYATLSGGYNNIVTGAYATICGGAGNTASGQYSSIIGGSGNVASGYASSSFGIDCSAAGNGSLASGYLTTCVGNYAICDGYMCASEGNNSLTVGNNLTNYADNSVCFGLNNNISSGTGNAIINGQENLIDGGQYSTITASYDCSTQNDYSAIIASQNSVNNGINSVILCATNGENAHNNAYVSGQSVTSRADFSQSFGVFADSELENVQENIIRKFNLIDDSGVFTILNIAMDQNRIFSVTVTSQWRNTDGSVFGAVRKTYIISNVSGTPTISNTYTIYDTALSSFAVGFTMTTNHMSIYCQSLLALETYYAFHKLEIMEL